MTSIEWVKSADGSQGRTWNPVVGCSLRSPGCTNCYAMQMAARIEAINAAARGKGKAHSPQYDGTTRRVNGRAVWTGKLNRAPEKVLREPLERTKPTTYFVNSMSDLFHEDVPDEWIDQVFAVMALARHHTFQVLTKRSARMRDYLSRQVDWSARLGAQATSIYTGGRINLERATELNHRITAGPMLWPLQNVWLGVSTERQEEADARIPDLLATPAAVRFISAEPLLGPIDLTTDFASTRPYKGLPIHQNSHDGTYHLYGRSSPHLDQVIVGGESGLGSRPMQPEWPRNLRDQCAAAGIAFFFKQWGEFLPVGQHLPGSGKISGATVVKHGRMKLHYRGPNRESLHAFEERGVEVRSTTDNGLAFRVGKSRAGNLLDGCEHLDMPSMGAPA